MGLFRLAGEEAHRIGANAYGIAKRALSGRVKPGPYGGTYRTPGLVLQALEMQIRAEETEIKLALADHIQELTVRRGWITLKLNPTTTDAELAALRDKRFIVEIDLSGAAITEKSLEILASISSLHQVDLSGTEVSEKAIKKTLALREVVTTFNGQVIYRKDEERNLSF